jgi:hypothetical protein
MVLKVGTLGKADEKHPESFEMCWRKMEKISWTDVRNEVLRKGSR